MGRRHTSDATDDASQYYRLIPRGTGFPQSDEAVEKGKADAAVYTAQVNSWRHELLKAYDYTTRRENEISRIFFIKAIFINKIPRDPNTAKRVLKLLVCDQSTLFEDDDSFYRSHQLNSIFLSEQKKRGREYLKLQNELMDKTINLYLGKHISDIHIDNTMFRKLLNEIIKEAAQKRISVYDWLYSKKHIRKSIEEGVQESNLIWNVERLDLDLCWEDCERLLLKCGYTVEYDEHNKECFESFIYRIVLFYIEEQGKLKTRCPEAASYRDESRDSYTVPALQHRLSRLEKLENAFNSKLCSTGKLYQLDYWGLSNQRTDKRTEQIILRISEEIQKFFQTMGLTAYDSYFSDTEFQSVAQDERQMHLDSRKQYSSDYLKKRILWVIHLMSNGDIDERFGPIFMLNMVMACKIQLFGDPSNDKVQPNTMLIRQPLYFSRIPPARQRCAHLQFLCALRDIFSLSDEDLYANLREYLCLYGVSILSYDELELWTRILREEYDRIPHIGFQLCFYDYCNQCIPLHFEHLNYRPYSVLHLGGYFQFYLKNQQKLRNMAKQLYQKYRNEVREYKKAWKKPELRGAELEKNLLQILHRIPLDLTEFEDVNCYDESELRLLILETILQMQIRMHAIQVLLYSR